MKTFLLFMLACFVASPVTASQREDHLRTFANCAGRLTAQLEHEWLMSDPKAQITEQQRRQVIELLQAVQLPDHGRDVLMWRVAARAAHRSLLQRAAFSQDADDAVWAEKNAQRFVADCTAFLLS